MTDQVALLNSRTATDPDEQRLWCALIDALTYARDRDYTGWDYCDGLSSRLLRALPFENRWLNLIVQESVKRSPVNLRPLFLVEQRRNYKGAALFAMTNLILHRLGGHEQLKIGHCPVDYETEAKSLLDWLIANRSRGYAGFCGGHKHAIQTLEVIGRPNDPSIVSTAYPVRALLAWGNRDTYYADVARTAADFVIEDLNYRPVDGGAVIDYHVKDSDDYYTINAGALGARMFLDLYEHFGDDDFRDRATAILTHVASLQTQRGGWYYREPPTASHLSMDSIHNGFIIESLLRYAEVVDSRFDDVIDDALSFYRTRLFEASGAPTWDESSTYPRDVHACAQGILVFSYAGDLAFARRILDWTLGNLYSGDGRFYYRKHRHYTNHLTLMRWCQAWMTYALAEYLRIITGSGKTAQFPTPRGEAGTG